ARMLWVLFALTVFVVTFVLPIASWISIQALRRRIADLELTIADQGRSIDLLLKRTPQAPPRADAAPATPPRRETAAAAAPGPHVAEPSVPVSPRPAAPPPISAPPVTP